MPLEHLHNSHVAGCEEMLELSLWECFPLSQKGRLPYVWGKAKDVAQLRPKRHIFIFSLSGSLPMANRAFTTDAWKKDSLASVWRLDDNESFHDLVQLQAQLEFLQTQTLRRPVVALGPRFFDPARRPWAESVYPFMERIKQRYSRLMVYACEPRAPLKFSSPEVARRLRPFL